MLSFIFVVIFIAVIAIIVLIFVDKSKPAAPSTYTPPAWMSEESNISGRRPSISAEISENFYNSVQEYCQQNSITISTLIRNAVESYMKSTSASDSVNIPSPKPSPRKTTSVTRPDGSWKCPRCRKINASYVGTCSCGKSKE